MSQALVPFELVFHVLPRRGPGLGPQHEGVALVFRDVRLKLRRLANQGEGPARAGADAQPASDAPVRVQHPEAIRHGVGLHGATVHARSAPHTQIHIMLRPEG